MNYPTQETETKQGWGELHNENFHYFCFSWEISAEFGWKT
jgi:hypothetical protein